MSDGKSSKPGISYSLVSGIALGVRWWSGANWPNRSHWNDGADRLHGSNWTDGPNRGNRSNGTYWHRWSYWYTGADWAYGSDRNWATGAGGTTGPTGSNWRCGSNWRYGSDWYWYHRSYRANCPTGALELPGPQVHWDWFHRRCGDNRANRRRRSHGGKPDQLVLELRHPHNYPTQNASSSATIDFTGLSNAYAHYEVWITDLVPGTDVQALTMQVGTGAGPTWQTGTSYGTVGVANRNGAATATRLSVRRHGCPGNRAIFVGVNEARQGTGFGQNYIVQTGNLSSSLFKCFFNRQSAMSGSGFATNDSNIGVWLSATAVTGCGSLW